MRSLVVTAVMSGLLLTTPVWAQEAAPETEPGASQRVDVDRLPLDLHRLENPLQKSVERQDWDGFRLRYTVDVFGKAPRIQFFEPKDVLPSGPIPYGAPTHREMVDVMTPKEYRAPAMDFSALVRWFNEKFK